MTSAGGQGGINHKERIARTAVAMPAGHPELVTRKPGRAEMEAAHSLARRAVAT